MHFKTGIAFYYILSLFSLRFAFQYVKKYVNSYQKYYRADKHEIHYPLLYVRPEECPVCHAPGEKFVEVKDEEMNWAAEHAVGIAKGVPEEIVEGLRANFNGECSEVGMYLAMARVAFREGYPEIGLYWEKAAYEEAEHAAKFAEMLGEVVTDSTEKNLKMRVEAENGATARV